MAEVTVTVNGRTYKMACDDGEERHLIKLADHFNGHVEKLKQSFGQVGEPRLLLMAGLMVCDELEELKKKLPSEGKAQGKAEPQAEAVPTGAADEATSEQALARAIDDAAKRLEHLTQNLKTIDQV